MLILHVFFLFIFTQFIKEVSYSIIEDTCHYKIILEWLPLFSVGNLSNPGIECASPESPVLAGRFTAEPATKMFYLLN